MHWLTALAASALLTGSSVVGRPSDSRPAPPTVADPIVGLDLWQGARVGMDMAALKRQFPAAVSNREPTALTGGQTDLLELDGLNLAGHRSSAHFYFFGNKLITVELTVSDLQASASARNVQSVQTIAAAYSARFGPGYDCGSKSLGDVDVYECKWLHGRVAVQLWYMDVAGQAPLFYLAFKQADDPAYNL